MLYYAAVFVAIGLIAKALGFGVVAVGTIEISRILFLLFIAIFLVSLIAGLGKGRWRGRLK